MKAQRKERDPRVTVKAVTKTPLEFVKTELEGLSRGIVATPTSRESLEAFAKANGGSMDILLMQMAIQYGASLAYQNVQDVLDR